MDIKEEQIVQQKKMEKILYTYGLENLLSTNITEDKDLKQFDYGIQEIFNNEPEVVFYYLNDPNMQYIINSNYCENINTFFLNNPTLVLKYRHTQFVQQYQHAQELIKQIGLSAENISDENINEIETLFKLSKNNIFAKQFIKENLNTIFEKRPDLLLCFDNYKIVQDFIDKLKTNGQYDIIKNWLKEDLKNYPTNIIDYQNTFIVKLYSEDLLKDQEFRTLLDNTLKQPENKHFLLLPKFENNSFIKDFVKNNLEDINKILEANPKDIKFYKDSKVVQQYQEAQELINQIDLDAENLLKLSDNNIFAKQFIEKNQNEIFEKRPDLLLDYNDNKIVKNFVDKLKKDSKEYKTIKNGLKQYLTENRARMYGNSHILELCSEDLLKDQDFIKSLDNDLTTIKNNRVFLSQEYENNSLIKDFVKRNPDHINKILTNTVKYLITYSDGRFVQNFTDNLKKKDLEQYEAIKNRLKEYLKENLALVIKYQNTTIIEDLLKDQDFRTLLYDTLKKPQNNRVFLSQKYQGNSLIKDFIDKNPDRIKEILEANPSYINDYKDIKVVQQYQEAQKLKEDVAFLGQVEQDLSSIILSNSSTKERK